MRRRGLTLLEALVALAITALVLAGVQGAVLRAAAARGRAGAAAERVATARTLLLRLGAELEAARPADAGAPPALVVEPPVDGAPPWSALRLTSAVRDPGPAASDVHALGYEVTADPEHPGRGLLERRAAVRAAAPDPAVPLVPGVRRFEVRCFDGSRWRRDWPPGPLPVAVEVALALDDGDELRTTVALALGGQ